MANADTRIIETRLNSYWDHAEARQRHAEKYHVAAHADENGRPYKPKVEGPTHFFYSGINSKDIWD
jgi:hypothetical protein